LVFAFGYFTELLEGKRYFWAGFQVNWNMKRLAAWRGTWCVVWCKWWSNI